jgi:hypothetical protein
MPLFSDVDAPWGPESMRSETGSLETASSTSESGANLTSSIKARSRRHARQIRLDVAARRIDLLVDDAELERRP